MIQVMTLLAAAGTLGFQAADADAIKKDEAFKSFAGMIGGKWEGKMGKLDIRFTYKLLENGRLLEGVGSVFQNGKSVLNMDSKFGWDPEAKQVYYLDCHGHDTIYNGHVTKKDGKIVIDFKGLVGDKGHYVSYAWFPTKDEYEFDMYSEKDGQMKELHKGIKLHRVK